MDTAEQTGQDEEKIRAFVSRYIRGSEWRNDEDMFELGLVNSLFAMQLVMFVEKGFGVTVEDEDLEMDNFRSVDAIAGFVRRKRHAGAAPEL
jgi:methoxymalonate biosynthesis acyl carrier protein